MPYVDPEKRKKYYKENRAALIARAIAHHVANRDKRLAAMRARKISPEERQKNKERAARSRKSNPEACRKYRLKKKYGMTVAAFEAMLKAQDERCAICGIPHSEAARGGLHVDHDHATKKVRGLLCTNCNKGIGCLMDDPGLLAAAVLYLTDVECSK